MRRAVPALIVLALVGAGLALYFAPSRPQAEIRRARALLVPPPPGAREVGQLVETTDENGCDESFLPTCIAIPPGETSARYVVFRYRGTSRLRARDVTTWYRRRLLGWNVLDSEDGYVLFASNGMRIEVDAQELIGALPPTVREFWVSVYPR
jgi:hypothetical protein